MNTQSKFITFIALLCTCFVSVVRADDSWQQLQAGLMYQDIAPLYLRDWSHIHIFKVDPKQYTFELIQKKETGKTFPTINQYADIKKAKLTFNAGFFDAKLLPLGLRISNFKKLNNFKNISWWGVFYIQNHQAHIASAKTFSTSNNIEFAIQCGPRLLVNGHKPSLKAGYAERTALCILPNQEVAVVITQYLPMTLPQLAQMLGDAPLHCQNAINLDGGSSTQFLASFPGLHLHMPGLASVSDAISVIPRQ
jgi:uncharacterized protein YigE (DUF2233 family)